MKGDDWWQYCLFLILRNGDHIKRCLTSYVQTVRELSNFMPVFIVAEKTKDAARWGPDDVIGGCCTGKGGEPGKKSV
jgi:hypothetical protein